jgi:ubiquinone/menaquinone biosynthesis C-methylase UbiE
MSRDIAGFFDAEAERYDRAYDEQGPAGRVLRERLSATLRLLGEPGGSVLDAGMAAGRFCGELAERGWKVTGIDVSPGMVALARRRLPGLELAEGRLEALPFPDSSFDAVVATGVLEYVDDLDQGIGELARVLRPGGRGVVSFPNYGAPHNLWRTLVVYPVMRLLKRLVPFGRPAPERRGHTVPRARFEAALTEAGLRIKAAEPVGTRPAPGRLRARQIVYAIEKPA